MEFSVIHCDTIRKVKVGLTDTGSGKEVPKKRHNFRAPSRPPLEFSDAGFISLLCEKRRDFNARAAMTVAMRYLSYERTHASALGS